MRTLLAVLPSALESGGVLVVKRNAPSFQPIIAVSAAEWSTPDLDGWRRLTVAERAVLDRESAANTPVLCKLISNLSEHIDTRMLTIRPRQCHPGPCPPCILIVSQQCHCGRQTISNRCSAITSHSGLSAVEPLSCGQTCGRLLNCGVHHCKTACHPGPCEPCDVSIVAECYCGRERKPMTCGTGEPKECAADGKAWTGLWECEQVCDRPLDCGIHRCPKVSSSLKFV